MKRNPMGTLLCGCIILGALGRYGAAAPAEAPDSASYSDEKVMEANIKKAVEYYDAAVKKFDEGNLTRARKYIDQSLELDPGSQESIDLSRKITERANQKKEESAAAAKLKAAPVAPPVVVPEVPAVEKPAPKGKKTEEKDAAEKLKEAPVPTAEVPEAPAVDKKALKAKKKAESDALKKEAVPSADAGLTEVEKTIEKNKANALKYFESARRYFKKGNLPRAREDINKSLEYDAFDQAAIDLKQKITVRMSQEEAALAEKKAKPAPDAPVISSPASSRWLKRAQKTYRARDIDQALAYCTSAVQADPANTAAVQLKKRLETVQALLDAVKRDMVDMYLSKGATLMKEQNPLEALWWLNRASAILPEDTKIAGLLLSAQESAKSVLPGIKKEGDRKKIARVTAYFLDTNYQAAEQLARQLQRDYPQANYLTQTVQGHLLNPANEERSRNEYDAALDNTKAGRFENAFDDVNRSLYFDPYNYAARRLLEQIKFEMLNPEQPSDR